MNCTKMVLTLAVLAGFTTIQSDARADDTTKGWLFQRGEATPVFGQRPEKSRLKKWTNTAQKTLSNTRDRLTPWRKEAVDPIEANRRFFLPDMANNEDRPGIIRRWLTVQEEPPKPLTVPDWMALERPGFDRR